MHKSHYGRLNRFENVRKRQRNAFYHAYEALKSFSTRAPPYPAGSLQRSPPPSSLLAIPYPVDIFSLCLCPSLQQILATRLLAGFQQPPERVLKS